MDWVCDECGWSPERSDGFVQFSRVDDARVGYDPERHGLLEGTERGHFWFEARANLIAWVFKTSFESATSYLEIGCGTGFVMERIGVERPVLSMTGSDVLASGLLRAQERLRDVTLLQLDASVVPFVAEFDVVGAYDVLEHLDEDSAALEEFRKALKPGGGLVVLVPQHPALWSEHDERAGHARRYTASELRRKVAIAGFEIERITSLYCSLLPAIVLSRWVNRLRRNATAEYQPGRATNWLFARVLRIETGLIRAGLDMPFGGSLLLIARKSR